MAPDCVRIKYTFGGIHLDDLELEGGTGMAVKIEEEEEEW